MQAEIITIGDEILIGQVVDTNSAWMAQQLNDIGIDIKQITSVSDNEQHIINALHEAKQRADIIFITGGLGPTKDDITKNTLCKYFKTRLVFNEKAYAAVEHQFKIRGKEVTATNRKQAELPENCTPVYNMNGTASGMWFENDEKVFISLPGVPFEMKAMMENDILPLLKQKFKTPFIYHKTILTQGAGESFLADMIEKWEDNLPKHIRLAYLPSPGAVRLRLTAKGDAVKIKEETEQQIKKLQPIIEKYMYGYDDDTLEEIIGKFLREKKQTLSTAESCTGGYIAHLITSVQGSSDYFIGSVVSYANRIKENFLEVDAGILEKYGAVSEPVVLAMAKNIKEKFNTDYSIAVSGIAGPGGGTAEKPVGTVWIAIGTPQKVFAKSFRFGNHRLRNILVSAQTALNMLRKDLLSK
ncbi:MAG TPA: competence/damage-inducible protein A [Bacteroidia bacterium]|nr:competence/damage-inducible protein A [Bacteroidia bacterium]